MSAPSTDTRGDENTRVRTITWLREHWFLCSVLLYAIALGAFSLFELKSFSQLTLELGTLVFLVISAFLAMAHLTLKLQESTAAQIAALQQTSGDYVSVLRESVRVQNETLVHLRRTTAGPAPIPQDVAVEVRVNEVPYFLNLKDLWIRVRTSGEIRVIKVSAQPFNPKKDKWGKARENRLDTPSAGSEFDAVKLGDIGVRSTFDRAEVKVHVELPDLRSLVGNLSVPFSQRSFVQVPLSLE